MSQVPAGWYVFDQEQRYWDGAAWGEALVPQQPLQPTRRPRRGLTLAGIALLGAGAALLVGGVFAPWFPNASSLASVSSTLAFNLPSIVLAVAGVVLSLFRPTRTSAGLVAVLVGAWLAIGLISEFGDASWRLGQTLSSSAAIALLLAGIGCLATGGSAIKVDRPAVAWAAGSAVLAVLWIACEWLPWNRSTTRFTPKGATQALELPTDCCTPFQNRSMPANIREAATMLMLLAASILVPLIWRRTASGVGLAALGLLYLSNSATWIVGLTNPNMSRDQILNAGFTAEQVDTLHVTITASGLLGGWLATGAATGLLILGVMRVLAAIATPSRAATAAFVSANDQ